MQDGALSDLCYLMMKLAQGGDPKCFERIHNREYGLYYFVADTIAEPEACYRVLANKGVIGIKSLDEFYKLDEAAQKQIAQANHDYLTVLPFLHRRHLLGEDGVEWTSREGKTKVLFAFRPFVYKIPLGCKAFDVTSNESVTLHKGQIMAKAMHTYRIYIGRDSFMR